MTRYRNNQQTTTPQRAPRRAARRSLVLSLPGVGCRRGIRTASAFTLIEMLVVIAIIGILAAIGLPAMRGFGKSNALTAAVRQLQDDVSLARQRAISGHTDVYLVFIPPSIANFPIASLTDVNNRKVFTNLVSGQYTTYALFSSRSVGEQPGRSNPRYLTQWKALPEGMFIAASKFAFYNSAMPDYTRAYPTNRPFPFPLATNNTTPLNLPYIGFDYQGRLISGRDEIIPLARGSILYDRNPDGSLVIGPADVKETPPGNSITSSNQIHIEWLTGRARVESQPVQ
ncbi:MAG: prepilin-type N-terminal cleavage/methylation domain-containing protein [Verrucomicrobia bacterium]|nr:prepilin-type N-terminal cleavage/methylation domain-containing protein [Verrucomicrobiota bacterium]